LSKLGEKFDIEPLKKYVKLFSLDQFDDDDDDDDEVKEDSVVGGFMDGQSLQPSEQVI